MKPIRMVAGGVLAVVLVAGAVGFAQGPGGRRGGGPGGPGGPGGIGFGRGMGRGGLGPGGPGGLPLGQLNLSDAQREQARAIVARAAEEQRPTLTRLREAVEVRRKALEALPVDEGAIRSTTQALVVAETDMAVARAKVRSDIYALLTAEQQTKLRELRQAAESRRNERRTAMQRRAQQRGGRRGPQN